MKNPLKKWIKKIQTGDLEIWKRTTKGRNMDTAKNGRIVIKLFEHASDITGPVDRVV